MFRKTFTVPASWTSGPVTLWLTEWHGVGYLDHGQAYLDGQPISKNAIYGDDLKGALKPGTTHTLAIEIWGTNPVVGTPASIWLNYRPDAHQHQDLAGDWQPAADGLTYNSTATMPGPYAGPTLRRIVKLDAAHANQTAVLRIAATDSSIYGVIVNGTWISRFHHHVGSYFDLAITPYLKFGQDNQIVLFGGNGKHTLKQVSRSSFILRGCIPNLALLLPYRLFMIRTINICEMFCVAGWDVWLCFLWWVVRPVSPQMFADRFSCKTLKGLVSMTLQPARPSTPPSFLECPPMGWLSMATIFMWSITVAVR